VCLLASAALPVAPAFAAAVLLPHLPQMESLAAGSFLHRCCFAAPT
jgi:hypothetical protein